MKNTNKLSIGAALFAAITSAFAGASQRVPLTVEQVQLVVSANKAKTAIIAGYNVEFVRVAGDSELRDFYIAKYEVTQELYTAVTGDANFICHYDEDFIHAGLFVKPADYPHSDFFGNNKSLPADNISVADAREFVDTLNERYPIGGGYKFALPTEAQWVRAYDVKDHCPDIYGNFYFLSSKYIDNSADNVAWYYGNSWTDSRFSSREVGLKDPNSLGVYDMAGNVAEWVVSTRGVCGIKGGSYQSPAECLTWWWQDLTTNNDSMVDTYVGDCGIRLVIVEDKK